MTFDLDQLARRLTDAAQRAGGMQVTVSTFDLILIGAISASAFDTRFMAAPDVSSNYFRAQRRRQ